MERSSVTRWIFIALAVILFWQVGLPLITGKKEADVPPKWTDLTAPAAPERSPEQLCAIDGDGFRAELSSRGGSVKSFVLTDARFRSLKTNTPMDLANPEVLVDKSAGSWKFWQSNEVPERRPLAEARRPLRTNLLAPGAPNDQQVDFDDVDWTLSREQSDAKKCVFTYQKDGRVALKKTVTTTERPYELATTVEVQNLANEPKRHRMSAELGAWYKPKDVEGGLGRQSEYMTEVLAVTTSKTERLGPTDFEPEDFKKKEFSAEGWRKTPGDAQLASVSNIYFTQIVIPEQGAGKPDVETRIEEWWDTTRTGVTNRKNDPDYGHVYRARVAYPEQTLQPKATATYKFISYAGPKNRKLLTALDRGAPEVLNLGSFAIIVKVLVAYLYKLYSFIGSWGWAIVLMTITVRMLLFPLSISQIKNSVAMRRLKPEMDELNEKYKDDAAQRGLALQELWRKNGVSNPVMGCLPMLLQLPVWWALYTALQTAVELYHVPFGPVIPDLSAPGKYFIIPLVLGASSFLQQKLMPAQGDPQQQKMMLYMMPGIFTVMMLFLPAGLGVYMLTNSVLAIVQQLAVERYLKNQAAPAGQIEVREKTPGDGGKPTPALGKGKARARG